MKNKLQEFSDRLKKEMKNNGLNQRKLAEKLGVHPKTVQNWVGGKFRPEMGVLKELADALGVSVTWLATGATRTGKMDVLADTMERIVPGLKGPRRRMLIALAKTVLHIQRKDRIAELPARMDLRDSPSKELARKGEMVQKIEGFEWEVIQAFAEFRVGEFKARMIAMRTTNRKEIDRAYAALKPAKENLREKYTKLESAWEEIVR